MKHVLNVFVTNTTLVRYVMNVNLLVDQMDVVLKIAEPVFVTMVGLAILVKFVMCLQIQSTVVEEVPLLIQLLDVIFVIVKTCGIQKVVLFVQLIVMEEVVQMKIVQDVFVVLLGMWTTTVLLVH